MASKPDTHLILVRHLPEFGEAPRWEVAGYGTSQRSADERVKKIQGAEWSDIFATGPMEIVQPEELARIGKIYMVGADGLPMIAKKPVDEDSWLLRWDESSDPVSMSRLAQSIPFEIVFRFSIEAYLEYVDPFAPDLRGMLDDARSYVAGKLPLERVIAQRDEAYSLWFEMHEKEDRGGYKAEDIVSAKAAIAVHAILSFVCGPRSTGARSVDPESDVSAKEFSWLVRHIVEFSAERFAAEGLDDRRYIDSMLGQVAEKMRAYIPLPVFLRRRFGMPISLDYLPRENPSRRRRR